MTGKEVRLVNEMASAIISCSSKENEKDCMFRNTTVCDGIILCSSCSMRSKEGDE